VFAVGRSKNFAAWKEFQALRFCNVSGWIASNPASALKPSKTVDKQIVPITKDAFTSILKACDTCPDKQNRIRLRALVLVMRFTALRIRDVVTLRKDQITQSRIRIG
jgi:site-specific recombinase XerD